MSKKVNTGLALSVRQPFAWAILQGIKKKEYRAIPTKIRERVYIYASLKYRDDAYALKYLKGTGINVEDLPCGKILGSVEIIGCRPDVRNGYAWILANPVIFKRYPSFTGHANPVWWKPRLK
jgi:hypothetical protein